MAKQSKAFDISKYQITGELQVKKLVIEETGDEIEVKVKPLSWSRRNKIVSKCLRVSETGNSFDGDLYIRECLKQMVMEAPWGATNESFLTTIDERLGKALETLVPQAMDSGGDVNEIKKG